MNFPGSRMYYVKFPVCQICVDFCHLCISHCSPQLNCLGRSHQQENDEQQLPEKKPDRISHGCFSPIIAVDVGRPTCAVTAWVWKQVAKNCFSQSPCHDIQIMALVCLPSTHLLYSSLIPVFDFILADGSIAHRIGCK